MNFSQKLRSKKSLVFLKPATIEQIIDAQNKLNLSFSEDYSEYLQNFGVASFYKHELTGICSVARLNVVDVTLEEKGRNKTIPLDLYVIENTNIDDIVIWQSSSGYIYQTTNGKLTKLCKNLSEYIDL